MRVTDCQLGGGRVERRVMGLRSTRGVAHGMVHACLETRRHAQFTQDSPVWVQDT